MKLWFENTSGPSSSASSSDMMPAQTPMPIMDVEKGDTTAVGKAHAKAVGKAKAKAAAKAKSLSDGDVGRKDGGNDNDGGKGEQSVLSKGQTASKKLATLQTKIIQTIAMMDLCKLSKPVVANMRIMRTQTEQMKKQFDKATAGEGNERELLVLLKQYVKFWAEAQKSLKQAAGFIPAKK